MGNEGGRMRRSKKFSGEGCMTEGNNMYTCEN